MEKEYYECRKKALNLFRNKEYSKAVPKFINLRDEYFNDISLQQKSADLNILMTCYHHLIMKNQYESNKIEQFKEYRDEYWNVASEVKSRGKLKEWGDNILENLFSYSLDLLLKLVSEDIKEKEDQANELKDSLKDMTDEFVNIFTPDFSATLFYEQILGVIYKERQNFNRNGNNNYQNIWNTRWIIEVFLELTEKVDNYEQVRANVMNLMADLVYFYSDKQQERGAKEKQALKWLKQSRHEFPDNRFTENRIKEIKKILTANQQINRFRHDATNKISYVKDKLRLTAGRCKKNNLQEDLLGLCEKVEQIEGTFRLTQREGAKFERKNMKDLINEIVSSFSKLDQNCISFVGEQRNVELDPNYFVIAVTNLIENSLEAYDRNNISLGEKPVEIEFDYNELECKIADEAGGIPEGFQEENKLFEPYVSSKGIFQNVGLGLAQVQAAMELQDGEVTYSTDKQGTEFVLKLK